MRLTSLLQRLRGQREETAATYWETRYKQKRQKRMSGAGSYGHLAAYKADFLNRFVAENDVNSVIEFGCGDGNQLSLAAYPHYIGIDVAETAIALCRARFADDNDKKFLTSADYDGTQADISLSLDVVYHLLEDDVFHAYMRTLFGAAKRFVIIYSSDDETLNAVNEVWHVRHRNFTRWIAENAPDWRLAHSEKNPYPFVAGDDDTSFADFFVYKPLGKGA